MTARLSAAQGRALGEIAHSLHGLRSDECTGGWRTVRVLYREGLVSDHARGYQLTPAGQIAYFAQREDTVAADPATHETEGER